MHPWPFADLPNTAVFTTVNIMERRQPIVLITHDAEDGAWQFLCGTTNASSDARIVSLESVFNLDPGVAEVADLPLGWRAWRSAPGDPWQRAEGQKPQDS